MEKIVRYHFVFYGRVQGVGFRYMAQRIARMHHLTGRVKNMPDGSVDMEAQGKDSDIWETIGLLRTDKYIRIDNFTVEVMNVCEAEKDFLR